MVAATHCCACCAYRGAFCRQRACVKLLCELGLFEDAVSLALSVDLELAKAVANTPEDDDNLRRKLWLNIAKHVVQGGTAAPAAAAAGGVGVEGTAGAGAGADDGPEQAERIKMAVEFLKEAGEEGVGLQPEPCMIFGLGLCIWQPRWHSMACGQLENP